MGKTVKPLTDTQIRKAKPKDKSYKLSDGDGLYLLINKTGSKLWRFDYSRPSGGRNTIAIGKYPEISLIEAREIRLEKRKQVAHKIDPAEANKVLQGNIFADIAQDWLRGSEPGWTASHMKKQRSRLDNDLLPWLGKRPIKEITVQELLATLRRIEDRCTGDAASRCKSIVSQIYRLAIATGKADQNIARDIDGALRKPTGKNLPGITDPKELAILLRGMDRYRGRFVTRCALIFTSLVFQRQAEIRQAEWSEINLAAGRWDIPAERMKGRIKHFVPLSRQAVDLLRELHPLTGGGRYVFPATTSQAKPLSENTVNDALKRMGYKDIHTAHGFRATARTILDEVLEVNPAVIEKQLAHTVNDPLGESYNRAQRIDKRIEMMQLWADYLDELRGQK